MKNSKEKNKKFPDIGKRIVSFIPAFNWIALIVLGKQYTDKISLICGIIYGVLTFMVPETSAYIWIIVMVQYTVVRQKMKRELIRECVVLGENQRKENANELLASVDKENSQQIIGKEELSSDKDILLQKKDEEKVDKPQVSFEDVVLGGVEEEKQLIPQKLTEFEKNVETVTSSGIGICFGSSLSKKYYMEDEDEFKITTSYYGYPSKSKFIKDMKKFVDKIGKKVPFVSFMTYWPTYDSMNKQQKAWYFYWRTEVRNGNYIDTDLSYIFIYVYELLSGCGWKEAQEGYNKLMSLWMEYRERYPKLDNYLFNWTFDFAQLHDLEYIDPEINDIRLPCQQTIKDILIDKHSEDKPLKLSFALIDSLCDYSLTGSKFYRDGHQLLIQEAIPRVIALVDASLIKKKNRGILSLYGPNRTRKQSHYIFQSAVCPKANKRMDISVKSYTSSQKLRSYMNELVRYAENTLRAMYGARGRLRGVTVEKETAVLIEKFLKKEYSPVNNSNNISAQKVEVKLDFKSINELRTQSDAVREALNVPEYIKEKKELLIDLEEFKAFLETLSSEAKLLLDTLLESNWECVSDSEKTNLVNEINRQANKYLACTLIIQTHELLIVEEDYRDELKDIYINQIEVEEVDTQEEVLIEQETHFIIERLSNEMQQLITSLTSVQVEILYIILGKESLQTKIEEVAEEAMTMPEIVIDEINEMSMQYLDDILIDTFGNEPCILEQYEEELKQAMK